MSNNTSSGNLFKKWKEKRAARKQQLEEQAAMEITNDTAENENKIIAVLDSVDFLHSKLPEAVLDYKTNPDHPCGDLEYRARAIVAYMRKNPQSVLLDIRKIDEKILELAYIFNDSIKNGEPTAAIESSKILLKSVREIRSNVPVDIEANAKLYIDTYVGYLNSCIVACELAAKTDNLRSRCSEEQANLEEKEAFYKEKNDAYAEELKNDPDKAQLFYNLINTTTPEERLKWGEAERELHKSMVARRMDGVTIELMRVNLAQHQMQELAAQYRFEALSVKVQTIPAVNDPNLMNKYNEEIDNLFKEFARADLEIDESLRSVDEIEGRLKQLETAPGAVRAREVAVEQADQFIKDIQKQQEDDLAKARGQKEDTLRRLGIRSDEEMEQMKAEIEAQQEAAVEEMMDEDNTLYN